MFRGETKFVYLPDPHAAECPPAYTGTPPMCMSVAAYGAFVPSYINPNVIKSMIG